MYTVTLLHNHYWAVVRTTPHRETSHPVFERYYFAYRWLMEEKHRFIGHKYRVKIKIWSRARPRLWWALNQLQEDSLCKVEMFDEIDRSAALAPDLECLLWRVAEKLEYLARIGEGVIRGECLTADHVTGEIRIK